MLSDVSGFAWSIALVAIGYFALRRFCIWWFMTSPRTLEDARLATRFRGLILFGLDGASISFRSVAAPLSFCWTKELGADGVARFRIDIRGAALPEPELRTLLERIGKLSGGRLGLVRKGDGGLEGWVDGPLASNHDALESVARSIVSVLGLGSETRFRFESHGPRDERAMADHFGWSHRFSENHPA